MSTQGTGSISKYGYERLLLENWGDWARNGIYVGYSRLNIYNKPNKNLLFNEKLLIATDEVVASMPPYFRRVLKETYVRRKGFKIAAARRADAVAAFAEYLERASIDPESVLK